MNSQKKDTILERRNSRSNQRSILKRRNQKKKKLSKRERMINRHKMMKPVSFDDLFPKREIAKISLAEKKKKKIYPNSKKKKSTDEQDEHKLHEKIKNEEIAKVLGTRRINCLERCMSIRTFIFAFTLFSLTTLTVVLTSNFLFFSNWNVNTIFEYEKRITLLFAKTRLEKWLRQGGFAFQQISDFLNNNEDLFDWKFTRNNEKENQECDRIHMYMMQLVRGCENLDYVGVLHQNGNVVISGENVFSKRNYTYDVETYNYTDGFQGTFFRRDYFPNSYEIKKDWYFMADKYDPLNDDRRGWYLRGVSYKDYYWNHFLTHVTGIVSTSLTKEIQRESEGDNDKVFAGAMFSLNSFNVFLQSLHTQHGEVILIDKKDGLLIASSIDENIAVLNEKTQRVERIKSELSTNSVIRSTAEELLRLFTNYSVITEEECIKLGTYYYFDSSLSYRLISCTTVSVLNLDVLIIYSGSYVNLFGYNIIGNVISVVSAALVTFVFMILSVISLYLFFNPLMKLISDLKLVDRLDFESLSNRLPKYNFVYEAKMLNTRVKFMLSKLTEYKSFIPITIKGSMEMDEDYSASSDDSGSSGAGNSQSNPNCKVSLTEFLVNKMSIKIEHVEGFLLVVNLHYCSIKRWMNLGNQDYFLSYYDELVKYIFERCRGNVIKIDHNCVVLFYRIPFLCLNNAKAIQSFLKDLNEKCKKNEMIEDEIRFCILIERNKFFKGIIGNKMLKLPAVFYNTTFYEKVLSNFRDEVIIMQNAYDLMDKELFIPVDLIIMSSRLHLFSTRTVVLYKYIGTKKGSIFLKIEKNKFGEEEREGMKFFLQEEWGKAVECFEKVFKIYEPDEINDKQEKNKEKKEKWKDHKDVNIKERIYRVSKFYAIAKSLLNKEIKIDKLRRSKKQYSSLFYD